MSAPCSTGFAGPGPRRAAVLVLAAGLVTGCHGASNPTDQAVAPPPRCASPTEIWCGSDEDGGSFQTAVSEGLATLGLWRRGQGTDVGCVAGGGTPSGGPVTLWRRPQQDENVAIVDTVVRWPWLLYVESDGSLSRIDLRSGDLAPVPELTKLSGGIAVGPKGNLYLSEDKLRERDPDTLRVIRRSWPLPGHPDAPPWGTPEVLPDRGVAVKQGDGIVLYRPAADDLTFRIAWTAAVTVAGRALAWIIYDPASGNLVTTAWRGTYPSTKRLTVAVRASDGKVLWQIPGGGRLFDLPGGRFLRMQLSPDTHPLTDTLEVLDAATGQERAHFSVPTAATRDPALALSGDGRRIYWLHRPASGLSSPRWATTPGTVMAFDDALHRLWTWQLPTADVAQGSLVDLVGRPVPGPDGSVTVAGGNCDAYHLDGRGWLQWSVHSPYGLDPDAAIVGASGPAAGGPELVTVSRTTFDGGGWFFSGFLTVLRAYGWAEPAGDGGALGDGGTPDGGGLDGGAGDGGP